jgi:Bacterial Ig domain/Cellulase (glycosyl hydrolase family 5)
MRRPHRSLFAVALVALAITTAGASGAGPWKPVIRGTAQVGAKLTADVSSWSGGPATFTYQWSRCDGNGNACATLSGATAQTYTVAPADVTYRLRVTAIPSKNNGTATSDPTAVVAPAPAPAPAPASVTLTSSIANGAVLSGSVAWIVNASGSGVARVDFFVDGTKKWTEAYAPYYFNGDPNGKLDTTTLSNSTHTLLAVAYGSSGNELGRVSVGVTVNNGSAPPPPPPPSPTVTLTNSIASGSTISGSVVWTVSASGYGIVRIDFLVDGVKKWTEQQAPYQFNGDPSGTLDTTTLINGGHTLVAVAYDSNSVELARASSSVTVSNTASSPPPPPPPPTSTTGGWPKYGTANGWKLPFRSTADQDFEISQDVALGSKYVRIGPNDAIIQKLLANGITPVILFGGNPTYPWTTTPSQLASQVSGYAAKWGNKILYECLNEVNIHGWTPDAYLPYLKAFYGAVKAAAPSATVLMNGLWTGSGSQALVPWSQRFIDLGGLNYTDLYNVHLYDDAAEHGAWSMWDMTFGSGGAGYYDTTNVRSLVDAWDASHGKAKMPIVSTESGGPTPKYTLTKQATIVTDALRAADGVGTGYRKLAFCLIYNVLDDDVSGFGMLDPYRNKRPSWYAFQSVATA